MIDFGNEDPRWAFTSAEDLPLLRTEGVERLFVLNGVQMMTWAELMLEFEAVMQFPAYFGRNLDALSECLADLNDWLPASSYRIFIRNACAVLSRCTIEDQKKLFTLLNEVSLEWANGTLPGANWSRDETPFRVVLQGNPVCLRTLQQLLSDI